MVSHAANHGIPTGDDHHLEEMNKNSNDASVAMSNSSSTEEASTSTLLVAAEAEECLSTPPKDEVIYDVIKHMRKAPPLVTMIDALCMSPSS